MKCILGPEQESLVSRGKEAEEATVCAVALYPEAPAKLQSHRDEEHPAV